MHGDAVPDHPNPHPSAAPECLPRPTLQRLAEALADAAPPEPQLVRLVPDATGIDVGLLPLCELDPDAEHLADALVGFDAPDEWWGIGVVGGSRLRPACVRRPRRPVPRHLTTSTLATRDGVVVAAIQGFDGDRGPASGRVPDLLRRSLGAGLPHPLDGPGRWFEQLWLDRALAAAANDPTIRWPALAALHPLADSVVDPWVLRARSCDREIRGWRPVIELDPCCVAAMVGFAGAEEVGWRLLHWVGPEVMGGWLLQLRPTHADLLAALRNVLSCGVGAKVETALLPFDHASGAEP